MREFNLSAYSQDVNYYFKINKNIFVFKEYYILYLLFFTFGFNKFVIYVALIVIFYFLKLSRFSRIKIKKSYFILFSLYLLFLLSLLVIGYDRLIIDNPIKQIFAIIIPIFIGGIIFQYQKYNIKLNLLGFYLLGLFLENFLVVAYSFYQDPIKYGYGNLISPFTNEELNSPGTSNMIAIALAYFYYLAIYYKGSLSIKILAFAIIILSLMAGVFLGGRTFFVIFLLIIIIYFVLKLSLRNLLYFLIGFIILLMGSLYIFNTNEFMKYYIEFILNRFDNGLESNRFLHYSHGLEMILQYPFGGFEVDSSIEKTNWYHNVFFDTARVAGWIPIIFFISALFYTSKFLLYRKSSRKEIIVPFVVTLITFLIIQQDVVIEGGARSIIVLFFSSYILIDSRN